LGRTESGISPGKQAEILELVIHSSFGHGDLVVCAEVPAVVQAMTVQGLAPWSPL
jgi:hypothetical protein